MEKNKTDDSRDKLIITGLIEVSEVIPRGMYFRPPRKGSKFKTESRHQFRDEEGEIIWWMIHHPTDYLNIPFKNGDILRITIERVED